MVSPGLEDTLGFFLKITLELTVLFIGISFLIGLLQEYVHPDRIKNAVGRSQNWIVNNSLGAGLGMTTPFCSCSTIPLLLGMLKGGVPFGAAMSFLIASPLINPVIMGLLIALLGIRVAAIYFIIVFPAAVLTGYAWNKLGLEGEIKNVTVRENTCKKTYIQSSHRQKIASAFKDSWTLFKQMLPWMLLGAGIGSLIYGYLPEELILKVAGPSNPIAIPAAALIGIPMYIRVETMIPISDVLISKGMGIGAVMALIIGGSGASIPMVSLLSAIFKRKLVIAFIITVMVLATSGGILFSILS